MDHAPGILHVKIHLYSLIFYFSIYLSISIFNKGVVGAFQMVHVNKSLAAKQPMKWQQQVSSLGTEVRDVAPR